MAPPLQRLADVGKQVLTSTVYDHGANCLLYSPTCRAGTKAFTGFMHRITILLSFVHCLRSLPACVLLQLWLRESDAAEVRDARSMRD